MPEPSPLLEVDGLVKHFPLRRSLGAEHRFVKAVDGVSFDVRAGELVALVGESGCGKTTTAEAVMRLVEADAGSVRFCGRELTGLSSRSLRPVRREMQMVLQDPYESLDPRFRVHRTLAEPLLVHEPHLTSSARDARGRHALERVGLTPPELYWDRHPHELSGGQRQRVAIAAALVLEPALLVADEPVSMLDVSVRAGILTLLRQLRDQGLGILMITHDLSTVAHFADRVCVMYLGRIVETGAVADVIDRPAHPYTRALLSAVPPRDPREPYHPQLLGGELPDASRVAPGCRFRPRCPVAVAACATVDPRLQPVDGSTRPSAGLAPGWGGGHSAACHLVDPPAARSSAPGLPAADPIS
ncbi:MAG: ABC transporter ATP-binding protein [Acidimicrobiales bacterium]